MGVNLNSIDSLSVNQKALIKKHLECVIEANKVTNLTRIDSMDSGMLLHIEDSLAALEEVDKAPAGKYVDLGSGGGFPGFPLAIATGRKTTLIDARQRKVELLNDFAEQLSLSDRVIAVPRASKSSQGLIRITIPLLLHARFPSYLFSLSLLARF